MHQGEPPLSHQPAQHICTPLWLAILCVRVCRQKHGLMLAVNNVLKPALVPCSLQRKLVCLAAFWLPCLCPAPPTCPLLPPSHLSLGVQEASQE
jgi:hypothetical protein